MVRTASKCSLRLYFRPIEMLSMDYFCYITVTFARKRAKYNQYRKKDRTKYNFLRPPERSVVSILTLHTDKDETFFSSNIS